MENVIERGMILCEGDVISESSLSTSVRSITVDALDQQGDENLSIKKAEELMERDLISKALIKTQGNRTQAAKILEISHRSLLYKLKEFRIE